MERSKRNASEQKCEKLASDLKRYQQSCKTHEKQIKEKDDEVERFVFCGCSFCRFLL